MSAFFRKLQYDTDFLKLILGFLHLLETIGDFIKLTMVCETVAIYGLSD
jgi:hypothetical protein